MPDKKVYFKNFNDLLVKLTKAFSELRPEELRNLLFTLQEFRNNHVIPEDTLIYTTTVPIEGLEVTSEDKVSNILVGGVDKYINLKYQKKYLPPVVIIKGGFRFLIVYGEIFAIEAYIRKHPLKAIVLDLEERDIFEAFKFNDYTAAFLVPLIQDKVKAK